jgi:hypothetical protein
VSLRWAVARQGADLHVELVFFQGVIEYWVRRVTADGDDEFIEIGETDDCDRILGAVVPRYVVPQSGPGAESEVSAPSSRAG